jgi:acetyl-CoA C-acetyltransferase
MERPVILSAVRTPIGRFLGTLKNIPAVRLGATAVAEAVRRAGIAPDEVDEVILGNVVGAGLGQNPARQAALGADLPDKVAAMTLNKVCGSGLKAVVLGAQAAALGDARLVVAGGMESMSNAPYLLTRGRVGLRMGHAQLLDSMIHDGLWDAYEDFHMGNTGEIVAKEFKVSRDTQDAWAFGSHQKAIAAIDDGKFRKEIIPVDVPRRKQEPLRFEVDEGPRRDTSPEALGKLRPAFQKDGTVTAGNAPGVNDGAAAVVVTTEAEAARRKVRPLARIVAYATSGVAPRMVMMAPKLATEMVLEKSGWSRDQVDLYEFNEAFSVQLCALVRELEIDPARVNVHGGAVALGHPIGASGARILTTLLYAMADRGVQRGIAALCLGGGNAVAMAVERV